MHKRFGLLSLVNFCMQIETSVWLTFERAASNRFQVNNTRLPVRPKETPKICHHIFQFVPILIFACKFKQAFGLRLKLQLIMVY
jgi:hypothetical protein